MYIKLRQSCRYSAFLFFYNWIIINQSTGRTDADGCTLVCNSPNRDVVSLIPFMIVSEYDQEIPQSQTADDPVAPRGRAAQPSRDTRKTN